jgi:hypothetical protein
MQFSLRSHVRFRFGAVRDGSRRRIAFLGGGIVYNLPSVWSLKGYSHVKVTAWLVNFIREGDTPCDQKVTMKCARTD